MNLPVHPEFNVIDESPEWLVVDKPAPLIQTSLNDLDKAEEASKSKSPE